MCRHGGERAHSGMSRIVALDRWSGRTLLFMRSFTRPIPAALAVSPARNALLAAAPFALFLLTSACSSSGPGGEEPCSPTDSCPAGQVCVTGIDLCVVPKGCVQGDICGATCTNTKEDPANCGHCGTVCSGATPLCANNECAASCPTGLIACNGGCVNFAKDIRNCGSCGHTCGLLEACESGVCVAACNAPLGSCGGVCFNLQSDETNCGACNHLCPSSAELCSQGTCVASCPSTLVKCGKSCADFATDPWNCGGCDKKCDPGETCQNGVCT
jgi:Stigma-specific protein, Stig1